MKKKHIIMMSGVSGVGKTTMLDSFAALCERESIRTTFVPSPIRSLYAEQGLSSEHDLSKLNPEELWNFQYKLRTKFYDLMEIAISDSSADVVVSDRNFFDYFTYALYKFESRMTLSGYRNLRTECHNFMNSAIARIVDEAHAHSVYIPYPRGWTPDVASSDGYRNDTVGRNLIWDGMLGKELASYRNRNHTLWKLDIDSTDLLVSHVINHILENP